MVLFMVSVCPSAFLFEVPKMRKPYIRKQADGTQKVYAGDGSFLGPFPSLPEAKDALRQVEVFRGSGS